MQRWINRVNRKEQALAHHGGFILFFITICMHKSRANRLCESRICCALKVTVLPQAVLIELRLDLENLEKP